MAREKGQHEAPQQASAPASTETPLESNLCSVFMTRRHCPPHGGAPLWAAGRGVGRLGLEWEVLEPAQGVSLRGTSDDKLISGDVLRKLLVKLENHVDLHEPLHVPPCKPNSPVKVRKRASRRAVKGAFDAGEAEARGQRVSAKLMHW